MVLPESRRIYGVGIDFEIVFRLLLILDKVHKLEFMGNLLMIEHDPYSPGGGTSKVAVQHQFITSLH